MYTYKKVIQSGAHIELFEYEKFPIIERRGVKRTGFVRRDWRDSRRPDQIRNCKKNFLRLVRANLVRVSPPALVTLTLYDITTIGLARKRLGYFFQLLLLVLPDVVQISVPEFQRRGAVHFHCLVWGIPDNWIVNEKESRRIQNIWGWGYVDIVKTNGNEALANYLGKYMQKGMHDTRLLGKKAYSCSSSVHRPASFNSESSPVGLDYVLTSVDNLLDPIVHYEYDTEYLGRGSYKSFVLPIKKHYESKNLRV